MIESLRIDINLEDEVERDHRSQCVVLKVAHACVICKNFRTCTIC